MIGDSSYLVNRAFVSKVDRLNQSHKQNILFDMGLYQRNIYDVCSLTNEYTAISGGNR